MNNNRKSLVGEMDRLIFSTSACLMSMVALNVVRFLAMDLGMSHGEGFLVSAILLHLGLAVATVWNFVAFMEAAADASAVVGEDPLRNLAIVAAGSFLCLYGMYWFRNRVARALRAGGGL